MGVARAGLGPPVCRGARWRGCGWGPFSGCHGGTCSGSSVCSLTPSIVRMSADGPVAAAVESPWPKCSGVSAVTLLTGSVVLGRGRLRTGGEAALGRTAARFLRAGGLRFPAECNAATGKGVGEGHVVTARDSALGVARLSCRGSARGSGHNEGAVLRWRGGLPCLRCAARVRLSALVVARQARIRRSSARHLSLARPSAPFGRGAPGGGAPAAPESWVRDGTGRGRSARRRRPGPPPCRSLGFPDGAKGLAEGRPLGAPRASQAVSPSPVSSCEGACSGALFEVTP